MRKDFGFTNGIGVVVDTSQIELIPRITFTKYDDPNWGVSIAWLCVGIYIAF